MGRDVSLGLPSKKVLIIIIYNFIHVYTLKATKTIETAEGNRSTRVCYLGVFGQPGSKSLGGFQKAIC